MQAVTARAPAMTMENSPRATSAPPARHRPPGDTGPARRPVPGGDLRQSRDDGQHERGQQHQQDGRVGVQPEEDEEDRREEIRNGLSSVCAPSATSPDRAMPTRNAPTAAETWSCCAMPATRIVRPSTTSSSFSGSSLETKREMTRP